MNITLENRKLFEGAIANIGTRTLMSDEQRKAYWASKKGGGPSNGPRPSTKASVNAGATNKLPLTMPRGMNTYTAALAAAQEIALGNQYASKEAAITEQTPTAQAPKYGGDSITWSPISQKPIRGGDPITWSPTAKPTTTTKSTKYQQPKWSQLASTRAPDPVKQAERAPTPKYISIQETPVSAIKKMADPQPVQATAASPNTELDRRAVEAAVRSNGMIDQNGNPVQIDWSTPASRPGYVKIKVPAAAGESSTTPSNLTRRDEVWGGIGYESWAKTIKGAQGIHRA
jgi:hypothetical protein